IASVQAPLVQALADVGWTHVPGHELDRDEASPFLESDIVDALVRLNPLMAEEPERSEEHTSELQSRFDLVCRLLLEKKKPKPPGPRFSFTKEGLLPFLDVSLRAVQVALSEYSLAHNYNLLLPIKTF